jgi:C-terminal processing protease CtpA/Prc
VGILLGKAQLVGGGGSSGAGGGAGKLENPSEVFVRQLIPGSPAALSGKVEVGDMVLAIDGADVSTSSLSHVFRLLSGSEHSAIRYILFIGIKYAV